MAANIIMNTTADPYLSSRHYNPDGLWYDSFAKSGEIVWLVFFGEQFLAQVKNEQQCQNIQRVFNENVH